MAHSSAQPARPQALEAIDQGGSPCLHGGSMHIMQEVGLSGRMYAVAYLIMSAAPISH